MASWRKELKELTRRLPEVGAESAAMADAMGEKETDRGCALITGSIAENALEAILQTGTVSLSKTRRDELFGIDGVMGSFSAKIKVAFAFGLIDAELRDQFDRLREIRNAFAHAKVAINFNTPAVRHSCVGLLKSRDDKRIEPRNLYVNTTLLLM